MTAYPQFWNSGHTQQVTQAIGVSQTGGTTYGPVTYELWNDLGGPLGATTLKNCRIRPTVFNGASRVSSGYPILDDGWIKIAITGMNNAGDSTMLAQTTGYVPVTSSNSLLLGDIPKNCARLLSVQIIVPAGVGNSSQELYLELVYDEATAPLSLKTGMVAGAGIVPDWRDASLRRLRRGRNITANGTDTVTVNKGAFVYDGVPYNVLKSTYQLNQNAADGALAAGQSYIARLSQKSDKTVTVTKSNKGTAPVAPALPANEIMLGDVTVAYQAGGVSVINSGNIDLSQVLYGEFLLYAGTGLIAKVGAGTAITSVDQQPFSGSTSLVALGDNVVNRVWLNPDGTFSVTTNDTPPAVGSLKLGTASTSGGSITLTVDLRQWSDRASSRRVVLAYFGDATVGTAYAATPDGVPADIENYYLESVDLHSRVAGSTGTMKVDVKSWPPGSGRVGTTIYTSSGSDDQRPSVSILDYSGGNVDHEVNSFAGGTIFTFDIVSTHTTPAQDVFVVLNLRVK